MSLSLTLPRRYASATFSRAAPVTPRSLEKIGETSTVMPSTVVPPGSRRNASGSVTRSVALMRPPSSEPNSSPIAGNDPQTGRPAAALRSPERCG